MFCLLQRACPTITRDVFIIQPAAWFRLTLPSDYPPGRSVCEGHQHGEVQRYHLIVLKYVGLQITQQTVISTIQVIHFMSKNSIFFCFKIKLTFKLFSRWQQSHSTSFICLSQGMVRSLERANETYQTWEPKVRSVTDKNKSLYIKMFSIFRV